MSTVRIVLTSVLFLAAVICFTIGGMQLACRGPLLNNLYPADSENKPDSKPYYRQSGTAMLLTGADLLVNAAAVFLHQRRLFLINAALIPLTVIYIIVTAVRMNAK